MAVNPASLANLRSVKPGQVLNPEGRTNPAKREAGEKCWKALLEDFVEHGVQAIIDFREANPGAYVQLAASGLPAETKHDLNIHRAESLTEEQTRMMAEEYIEQAKRVAAQLCAPEPVGVHDSLPSGLQTSDSPS